MTKAVPYYRVSTARQGQSGLGLEAQQQAVHAFAKANGFTLTPAFVEVESGRKAARPVLAQALDACKAQKAMLLIAKLDRLSRNVAFVSRLMESGVEFKAVDNPYASKLVIHILAAFAEHEREQASARTSAALQAAKAKGVALGRFGRTVLAPRNRARSQAFALKMAPTIERLRLRGITTVRTITAELNRLAVPTYHSAGHRWQVSTVHKIVKQLTQNS